jgi:hypothetical protein
MHHDPNLINLTDSIKNNIFFRRRCRVDSFKVAILRDVHDRKVPSSFLICIFSFNYATVFLSLSLTRIQVSSIAVHETVFLTLNKHRRTVSSVKKRQKNVPHFCGFYDFLLLHLVFSTH